MADRNNTSSSSHEAVLSSAGGFTAFSYGGYNIRFRAPYSLERYVDVLRWDDGYLVVLAKYSHNSEPEEEYIALKPILEGLYIDSASFLKPIKSVRIASSILSNSNQVNVTQQQTLSVKYMLASIESPYAARRRCLLHEDS